MGTIIAIECCYSAQWQFEVEEIKKRRIKRMKKLARVLLLILLLASASFYAYCLSFGKEWVRGFDGWWAYILGIMQLTLSLAVFMVLSMLNRKDNIAH